MSTSVLQVDPLVNAATKWARNRSFEPTLDLAHGLRRAVNIFIDPAGLLSESREHAAKRSTAALAAPLIERIRLFASAVVHGEVVIAAEASPLVRQEAARLAVFFAESGLELTSHADEVAMPSVHQAPSGAVQFEWHRQGIDLEISVLPSGRITAFVESNGHEPREVDLTGGIASVAAELHAVLRR